MAKYHISEHKEEIITSLISNAIWYIVTLLIAQILLWVPLISGMVKTARDNEYRIPIYAFILAGISVVIMFVLMVVSISLAIRFYKKANSKNEITTDLIFERLDIELYFKDRENIITNLTYNCKVNKDNYNDEFKKNIIWTGGSYNYTKIVESNGPYTLTDSSRKASPYSYVVHFNKAFSLGDDIYFKLETSVNDSDLSMTPVFSHMVYHQTIEFNIRLTVPKDLIKNIRPTVYRDLVRTIEVPNDIRLITKSVGDNIEYSYSVDTPNLLNNYCIEWDFK